MQKIFLLLALAGAVLLCGCDKEAKVNSQKIELLSRNIVQFEQSQVRQMAAIQSQLTSLEPMLDKMNDFYFEKSHDEAFFFHTNTLYLLLMVDKKIESELQAADTGRAAQNAQANAQAYDYFTNQLGAMSFNTAQIQDALAGQEKRIEDNVNVETRRVGAALGDELLQQIKLSSAPAAEEIARRNELAGDVAQIKRELELIKAQLAKMTNAPAAP